MLIYKCICYTWHPFGRSSMGHKIKPTPKTMAMTLPKRNGAFIPFDATVSISHYWWDAKQHMLKSIFKSTLPDGFHWFFQRKFGNQIPFESLRVNWKICIFIGLFISMIKANQPTIYLVFDNLIDNFHSFLFSSKLCNYIFFLYKRIFFIIFSQRFQRIVFHTRYLFIR